MVELCSQRVAYVGRRISRIRVQNSNIHWQYIVHLNLVLSGTQLSSLSP